MKPSRRVIGITGNIATGKSEVSRYLTGQGFKVIDADRVAREVVAVGSRGLEAVVARFGDGVLLEDGSLDRKGLGEIVFNDPEALENLNGILHPLILAAIDEAIARSRETIIFVDGALLFETGYARRMDEIWLVTAPEKVRIERLKQRDGLTLSQARKRIDAQMDPGEKMAASQVIIENLGTLDQLHEKIDRALLRLGLDKAGSSNYN